MSADAPARDERTAAPDAALVTEITWVYRLGRFLSGSVVRVFGRAQFRGRENVPEGAALLVANHQSGLDIPFIATSLRRHVAFVARDSLAESKILSFVMRGSGAVLVRRGQADRKALRAMVGHLRAGDLVTVYPEGTRSKDGRVGPFRGGALLAARQARVPLVPVAIQGTRDILPSGARWPRFARATIEYGRPIDVTDPDALEQARGAILAMLGQSDGDAPAESDSGSAPS